MGDRAAGGSTPFDGDAGGGAQLLGAEVVEQLEQAMAVKGQRLTAQRPGLEQRGALWHRGLQPVTAGELARLLLGAYQALEVGGILDAGTAVVGADMARHLALAVQDADLGTEATKVSGWPTSSCGIE